MTLSEQINRMIQTALESADFTSANPTHINHLIQINAIDNPDLEDELKDAGFNIKNVTKYHLENAPKFVGFLYEGIALKPTL